MSAGKQDVTRKLLEAVGAGSAVCRRLRPTATVRFKQPPDPSDDVCTLGGIAVTSADCDVQETILRILLDEGLGHFAPTAEEDTATVERFITQDGESHIYVDPIDGTLAYMLGVPDLSRACREAGVQTRVVAIARQTTDASAYGIVIGATLGEAEVTAVCALPEAEIVAYSANGKAYRNGTEFRLQREFDVSRVVVNRRTLNEHGVCSELDRAGMQYERSGGSNPNVLRKLMDGRCSAYVGVTLEFDAQLMLSIARDAGYLVRNLE